jgi:hypothetical protein
MDKAQNSGQTGNPIVQTQNIFFETIKRKIAVKVEDGTLIYDLERVAANFEKDPKSKMHQQDYELVGMMAYLNGLDYTSQVGGLTGPVVTNVIKRFVDQKIGAPEIRAYGRIIKAIDLSVLEEPKDETTNLVLTNVKLSPSEMLQIRAGINNVLNGSNYPMKFALEINELKLKKHWTYQDFLKINSMIYEQIDLGGKHFKSLNKVYGTKEYRDMLQKGSEYFDLQKFALIYYESIFSTKEFNQIHSFPDLSIYFEDASEIVKLPLRYEQPKQEIVGNPAEMAAPPKFVPTMADQNNTDMFFRAVIEEKGERQIVTGADFMHCLETLTSDDSLVGNVYKFIKANQSTRRLGGEATYPGIYSDIDDLLQQKIVVLKEEYKELVIRYTEEIPADNVGRIVRLVNELIEASVVKTGERKSMLMQQYFNNQITTFKHLHETINQLEECNIDGSRSDRYTALHDCLKNSSYPFVKLFQEVEALEPMNNRLQVYQGVQAFLAVEITDENSFIFWESSSLKEKAGTADEVTKEPKVVKAKK